MILFAMLCIATSAFAQDDITSVKEVNFYGVDFSQTNLFGLEESVEAIQSGLNKINILFLSEAKKYDIGKYFKKNAVNYCLESTDRNNAKIDIHKMVSNNPLVEITPDQVSSVLASLSCENYSGTGLVIIAENLNKPDITATYLVVFFDEQTKDIIYQKTVAAKPRGFGFRNYWAGSLYQILRNWKY